MSETLRLFFALPVPPLQAQQILLWRRLLGSSGKLVNEQDLHVTLAFLGQQSVARLTDLQNLAAQLAEYPAFDLRLDHLGLWKSGLLHLAPSCPPSALLQLQEELAVRLTQLGIRLEQREYHPHLTLARHASWPTDAPPFSVAWRVERFALFSSFSVTFAPCYRQIGAWQLS